MFNMIKKRSFNSLFRYKHLFNTYINHIKNNRSPGVDGINGSKFETLLSNELNIIEKKIINNDYIFSPYKCLIISKGIDKPPRVIEKATIRDRIVLRIVYDTLKKEYESPLKHRALHIQVKEMIHLVKAKKYTHILRYDVKNFFPNVNHNLLLKKISKRFKIKRFIKLIKDAIENPHEISKKNNLLINKIGIPQGLSISTILANIFLFDIDKKFERNSDIAYFRFVDDILILCNSSDLDTIDANVQTEFSDIKLELHSNDKFSKQPINEEFDFLGYIFRNNEISIRKNSIEKLMASLINLFSVYKYSKNKNEKLLIFKLNLRITGCIVNNRKYGWIFYFSQLTEEKLLHSLDHFIRKQLKRFNVDESVKKFVRTWSEINYNFHETTYIPNYNNYKRTQKEKVLDLYRIKYTSDDIDDVFVRIINKEIKKLEKDMSNLS